MDILEMIANTTSIEDMEKIINSNHEYQYLYQEMLYDVRRDILFRTSETFANYRNLERNIREEKIDGFQYTFQSIKSFLPEDLLREANNERILQFNRMKQFAKAALILQIDYATFKQLELYDVSSIDSDDIELIRFLETFDKIKREEQVDYILDSIPNLKDRIVNMYEQNYNKKILKLSDDLKINISKQFSELNCSVMDGISFYDAGVEFSILAKTIGYGYRYGDDYKELWESDSASFLYESKSLIRNDFINLFYSENTDLSKLWSVGFEELNGLQGMASCDCDSNTDQYGNYVFGRKPTKRHCYFASPDNLINCSGLQEDDNTVRYNVYNEIDDCKYKNGVKNMPDYIIYMFSNNDDSIYSRYKQERFANSCKAAKDLGISKVLIVDIDKCVKHEYEQVLSMVDQYIKTKDVSLLGSIFDKINNNRAGEYSKKIFTDEFLSDIFIKVYNFLDLEQRKIIDDKMLNMANFSPKKYEKIFKMAQSNFLETYNLKTQSFLSEIHSLSLPNGDVHELLQFVINNSNRVQEGLLEEIEKNKLALDKMCNKILKTKKIKDNINLLLSDINMLLNKAINEIKNSFSSQANSLGLSKIDWDYQDYVHDLANEIGNNRERINAPIFRRNKVIKLDISTIDYHTLLNKKNIDNYVDMMANLDVLDYKHNNIEYQSKTRGYSGIQLLGLVASISTIIIAILGIIFLILIE